MPPTTRPPMIRSSGLSSMGARRSGWGSACRDAYSKSPRRSCAGPIMLGYGRSLDDWRLGPGAGFRRDRVVLAALPLADQPRLLVTVLAELQLACHGLEGAGLELLDDLRPIDLADVLDGLLQ